MSNIWGFFPQRNSGSSGLGSSLVAGARVGKKLTMARWSPEKSVSDRCETEDADRVSVCWRVAIRRRGGNGNGNGGEPAARPDGKGMSEADKPPSHDVY